MAVGNKSVNDFGTEIPGVPKVEIIGDAAALKDGMAAGQIGFRTGYYI